MVDTKKKKKKKKKEKKVVSSSKIMRDFLILYMLCALEGILMGTLNIPLLSRLIDCVGV